MLWFTGEDILYVPNKRFGGVCLGSKIAPIFYNTMEDAGALPIELRRVADGHRRRGRHCARTKARRCNERRRDRTNSRLKSDVLFDEVRAGGRIPLIVGRGLTAKAREALGLARVHAVPHCRQSPADTGKGYTLAQKMVGRACG